ncbi:MAG: dockerin type I repeat-containing protein [Planctomycetota bacterium]
MSRLSFWVAICMALFLGTHASEAQTRHDPKQPTVSADPVGDRLLFDPSALQTEGPQHVLQQALTETTRTAGARTGHRGMHWQHTGPKSQRPAGSGAQPFGPACVVDCTGATAEAEPCGSTSNDGCSVDKCGVGGFETISLNSSICGNVFAENGVRDVDYYRLTLTGVSTITADIQSELPVVLQLIEDPADDCSDWFPLETVFSDETCTPVSFTRTVGAGNYYLMVGISDAATVFFDGFPCGGSNAYRIDLTGASADCLTCTGTAELEPCGNEDNEGCNAVTPTFEAYTPGTTVCGTNRTFVDPVTMVDSRDIDWYEFAIAATPGGNGLSEITLDVSSEHSTLFGILEATCSGGSTFLVDDTSGCATSSNTLILPDGNYYFLIGPGDEFGGIFNGVECTDNAKDYSFTITRVDAVGSCVLGCVGDASSEPCGLPDTNFSCDPAIAEDIQIGTPFCGTAWAFLNPPGVADTDFDFHDFTLGTLSEVTITLTSTIPLTMFILDQNCAGQAFVVTDAVQSATCVPGSITLSMNAGDYTLLTVPGTIADAFAFNAGPPNGQIFDGFPCGFDNDFQIDIATAPPGSSACTINCPPAIANPHIEAEACGGTDNQWCAATPQGLPEAITIPTPICGTLSADGTRDLDFYSFTVTQTTDIQLELAANLPTRATVKPVLACPAAPPFFAADLANSAVFATPDCMVATGAVLTLAPGDYAIFVTTHDAVTGPVFGGFPCGTANDYLLNVNLAGTSVCEIVTGTCEADCNTGDIVLNLEAQSALDSIDIDVTDENGVSVATANIPGPIANMDMFTETFPGLPNGFYAIEITGNCSLGDPVVSVCAVALFTWNNPDSVVFVTEGFGGNTLPLFGLFGALDALPEGFVDNPGCVDSGTALSNALTAAGETVLVIPGQVLLTGLPCITDNMGPGNILWVQQGTFPNDGPITTDEGQLMADLLVAGVSIYQEGADVWGIDPPTPFYDFDGVSGNFQTTLDFIASNGTHIIANGDDSFTQMTGTSLAPGLDTSTFGMLNYTQDSNNPAPFYAFGNDSTDQLVPAAFIGDPLLDEGMIDGEAYETWVNVDDGIPDPTVTEPQYATGIHHSTTNPAWTGGRVLVQSFEFGGFPAAQQNAIAAAYVDSLREVVGEEFLRGDCNGDNNTNIADAVRVLNVLFPQNCTPGVDCPQFACPDACDCNDDGTINIADAVCILNVLFPQNCTPGVDCPVFPAPGDMNCGPDPTMDMQGPCVYTCP